MPPFFKTIRTKTLLSVIIPFVVVLILVAVLGTIMFEYNTQEAVKQRDTELATISAARLSEGLNQYAWILQRTGTGDDIRSMDPARAQEALTQAAANGQFTVFDGGVILYDSHGEVLAAVPAPDTSTTGTFPDPAVFARANTTLRPSYSNVFQDEKSGNDMILIAVPVLDSSGNMAGVLAGSCTLEYSLIGSLFVDVLEIRPGGSGYAYLVDGNGVPIYHRYMPGIDPGFAAQEPVQRVTGGETGAVLTQDTPGGDLVISAFAPVPGTSWGVITHEDWETVFGPRRNYNYWILVLIIAGGAISGALVFIQVTRILGPIQDLTLGAQRIGEGDFTPMRVPESGDEIQTLAVQFNKMVAALEYLFAERKKAESVLSDSEQRFRKIFEEGPLGMAMADLTDGRFFSVNRAFCEMLGYTEEELKQRTFLDVTHPDYRADDVEVVRRLREGQIQKHITEKRYLKKNGDVIWGSRALTKIGSADGTSSYALAMIENITGRKQAEVALRNTHERLRRFVDANIIGVVIASPSGSIIEANDYYLHLIGYTREEFEQGRINWRTITPPEWLPADEHAIEELRKRGTCTPYEKEYVRRDGTRVPVFLSDAMLPGPEEQIAAFVLDITEQKRIEEALRQSEESYRYLFENMLEGFAYCRMLFDESGHPADFIYLNVNPAFDRIIGVTTVTGKPVTEVFPGIKEAFPELFEIYGRVASTGEPEIFDIDFKPSKKWLQISVYSPAKEYFVAIFEDITERKLAEEALSESEERLRFALDGTNDGIWDVDLVTGKVYLSPRGCEILGFKPEELPDVVKVWSDLVYPEDLPATNAALDAYFEKKIEIFSVEQRLRTKPGAWKWMHTRGKAVAWDNDGRPLRMTGTYTDISDRKQAEADIRLKDELLHLTGEMAKVGGWEFDARTGHGTWTDEVARIHDMDPDQETSVETGLGFYSGEYREKIDTAIKDAVENAIPYDLELEMVTARGRHKWVRTMGLPILDDNTVVKVRGIFQDITERKLAEDALRESESRYRVILQTAIDGFWIADMQGRLQDVNETYCRMSGYTRPELLGMNITDVEAIETHAETAAHLQTFKVMGEDHFESRHRRKDGTVFDVDVSVQYRDVGGGHIIVFLRDITERKRAELELLEAHRDLEKKVIERTRELSDANERLKDLDRLKSMFIASMSHELRTPLNSIIGFTGIIVKGMTGEINPEQKKQLEMVQSSARHLLALINDVIDISKIEAGKIEASVSTFDLSDVLADAQNTFDRAAADQGLVLNVEIPGPVLVTSDERRIKQIIFNLISNGIKFTDEGRVDVTMKQNGDIVEVSVSDTGIGISEEDLAQLFRPFVRVQVPGRLTEGTGLGLYLSKKIARFLGGDISGKSELHKGSVFVFSFPVTYEKQEEI